MLSGCADTPEESWRTEERLELRDRNYGRMWFEKSREFIRFAGDAQTDSYLTELGNRLMRHSSKLKESPLSVYALKDEGIWSSFGLPGAKIFLSMRLLREIEYESVLAAALAMEIGKLEQRVLVKRVDEASPDGFTFSWLKEPVSIRDLSESAKNAVKILYFSGYDPRGLVSYWKLLQNNMRASFIDERSLKLLAEMSFEESSSLPPLMKPVVKSEAFLSIRRHWSQKKD